MKYVHKPRQVEAHYYTGDNLETISSWIERWIGMKPLTYNVSNTGVMFRFDLDGDKYLAKGDWMLRSDQGVFYSLPDDIFRDNYDPL